MSINGMLVVSRKVSGRAAKPGLMFGLSCGWPFRLAVISVAVAFLVLVQAQQIHADGSWESAGPTGGL